MAIIQPFVRLVDLKSNVALASTSTVVDWGREIALDKVATLTVELAAGDPGEANPSDPDWLAFGAAFLRACADLGQPPRPLLIELSLDGGLTFDSRKLIDHPARALVAARRTIKEDGPDIASLLSTIPQERVTYTECALQDVLNAEAGTIVPLIATGFLTADNTIPYLAGVLTIAPGLDSWDSDGRQLLKFVAIIHPDVQTTPTNVDVDSATTLAVVETVINRLAGAAPLQDFGHYVADCSDADLNLSSTTSFAVTSPAPCTNALVVGHKGTSPYITFDATGNEDVDETTTARVHLDASSITTDDSTIYHSANFVGGKSSAGWPAEGKVSGMALINTQIAAGVGMSGTRDQWEDCVPLIGIDAGDNGGGIYYYMGDGTLRRLYSPNARCLALAYDQGDEALGRANALFFASPQGIYVSYGVNLLAPTLDWTLLHTKLNFEVTRIQINPIPMGLGHIDEGYLAVWALVTGKGDHFNGVWRCTTGSVEWEPVLLNQHVIDMCSTDFGTFWTILQANQGHIYRWLYNETSRHTTQTPANGYALPSGKAHFLQRVITAEYIGTGTSMSPEVPGQDSIWALMAGTSGPASPAYYLVNDVTGTWASTTFRDANADNTLKTMATGAYPGKYLQAFRAGGLGFEINGQYVSVLLGTDSGIYWSKKRLDGTLDWHSANEIGGLGSEDVHNIAAGDYQYLLGDTSRKINRIFVVTENDLLVSNSAGRWWHAIKERDRTTMGPHLSQICLGLSDDLPSNKVRTWGTKNADGTNMVNSPITGLNDGTHIYIPSGNADAVPQAFYFERFLDGHLDFQYRLVSQSALFPGQQMSQLPELQSNQAVEPDRASKGIMTVAKRWLQQHSQSQTLITIESSFSTVESALRTLRPTHKAKLIGHIVIRDVSVQGAVTSTRVLDFDGSEDLWVLAHSMHKGPGNTATTMTTLAPYLREMPTSENDMMASLTDSLNSIKRWG